ncbi:response regulator [Phormidesmis priestleyi ULC007]|uniref:Response regulator n=1 Tax=Phormidesmis priestleyi ULC007 TaxID=1920490 RepID=A0A2T1DBI0_9CYAN|nr:response regulator [Phormidesmis priestleyi]PSB17826.1 response regulator [Phormidesmis priestleyi ULC007]PZO46474.1 MAG: response regulator [Phormidesmis priestleyi]
MTIEHDIVRLYSDPAIAPIAYAGEYDQQQALNAGFQKHLTKPDDLEALVKIIVTLVERTGND